MNGNDAFLWYNVGDWGRFGLAVPNFSDDTQSQNDTIRYLTDVMGRNLQAILWHPDASLRTPPSINTLTRIHKLCTRARSILAARSGGDGVSRTAADEVGRSGTAIDGPHPERSNRQMRALSGRPCRW